MRSHLRRRSGSVLGLIVLVLCSSTLAVGAQEVELDDQLFQAVDSWSSDEGEVTALIDEGANPNAATEEGVTPLMVAALNSNEGAVGELLAAGARVDASTQGGATALMFAAREDEDDVASLLLAAGAKGNGLDKDGWTALMYAAHNNAWQCTELFIKDDLDLDKKTPDGWAAVLLAAAKGHSSLMDKLLKAGAKLPAMSPEGLPTLVRAARGGDSDVVLRTMEFHPNLEVCGPEGQTPLVAAAAAGHTEVLMELLRRGAKKDAKDAAGRTALALAQERNDGEMVALLGGPWKPYGPAENAFTISLTCETLGGEVQMALEPRGDQLELAVYYPQPVSAYLGGSELCPIDRSKRKECGFKRFSADAAFFFDLDNNKMTGQKAEFGDSQESEGAEFSVSVSEMRTSVTTDEGRVVSRQVLMADIAREGESLGYEETEGHFQSAERDLNRLVLSGPLSVLGIQSGQKLRLAGEIDLCGAGEQVVTLK